MWISGGGEVRECLPCKCEVLSSNPSTAKKKKKKKADFTVCGNLRYLGGRDQEDQGSRPAQAKSSQDSISTSKLATWEV
jgi:hypothetical protein